MFFLQSGPNDGSFDLEDIFIGRQQQLDLFKIYLNHWKQHMLNAESDDRLVLIVE